MAGLSFIFRLRVGESLEMGPVALCNYIGKTLLEVLTSVIISLVSIHLLP